jgi:hypothetical protein
VSFEAESGILAAGATLRAMSKSMIQRSNPEREASGRAFVELKGRGQSVTWVNRTGQSFTAVNLRFSIPDAPNGGGSSNTLNLYVNGVFRQSVSLSSAQCWLYQNNRNKNPAGGKPYKFFDETHFFIKGAPLTPGSALSFRQDPTNTAAFYWLDVVDLETPPPPLPRPANSLSIADFGAVANDASKDSTKSIQRCFDAAAREKKIAWIPAGTFYLTTADGLNAKEITIQGAGMWYSSIYRNVPLPHAGGTPDIIDPVSCTIKDLLFDQNAPARDGDYGDGGGINIKGSHWLVDRVWVQHTSSGVWGDGSNGAVTNCRMLSTWGDGINLNNGNTGNDGNDLTAENNFVRGSGDDGLAINSDASSHQMNRVTLVNNTSVAPWGANGLGIYGGKDIVVKDNLIMDAATESGLSIGVFGDNGAMLESGSVQGNVILRSGDKDHPGLSIGTGGERNSIQNVYVGSNLIQNPITRGVAIRKGTNIVIQNNRVDGGRMPGYVIEPEAQGSGIFVGNQAMNISTGAPDTLKSTERYRVIVPVTATAYRYMFGNIFAEACSEGGRNITRLTNGSYTSYPAVSFAGVGGFTARVSGKEGGTISVYLDQPKGTPIATCAVPATGGAQKWTDVSCPVTAPEGSHEVFLVYSGKSNTELFDIQWFAFVPGSPAGG